MYLFGCHWKPYHLGDRLGQGGYICKFSKIHIMSSVCGRLVGWVVWTGCYHGNRIWKYESNIFPFQSMLYNRNRAACILLYRVNRSIHVKSPDFQTIIVFCKLVVNLGEFYIYTTLVLKYICTSRGSICKPYHLGDHLGQGGYICKFSKIPIIMPVSSVQCVAG